MLPLAETTGADGPRAFKAARGRLAGLLLPLTAAIFAAAVPRVVLAQAARSRPAATMPVLRRPVPAPPTDRQVDAAIRRGLDFLWKRQSKGRWDTKYSRQYPCGAEALATLAALSCGQKPGQANVKAALQYLGRLKPQTVYARAMRTMVYARLPGEDYSRRLATDVAWLVANQSRAGGWGYGPKHPTTASRKTWVDNSNTQLALLALHDAAEAGAAVPPVVWRKALRHWLRAQNEDGGWGYEPRSLSRAPLRSGSYGSLTAAGVASLLILQDRLLPAVEPLPGELFRDHGDESAAPGRAIARGLEWLDRHYTLAKVPRWLWGGRGDDYFLYYLHCLVRVAETAGMHSVGGKDWAPQVVSLLLRRQRKDGSWSLPDGAPKDAVAQTSFALLVLARCRTPILVSRLAFGGKLSSRARDAERLVKWLPRVLGRRVAWLSVDPNADAEAYRRAPILYISAAEGIGITAEMGDKIVQLLRLGGTALIQGPGGDRKFAAGMVGFFRRAAPQWKAAALGVGHPLFRMRFSMPPVAVTGIGDAERTRVFVLIDDLSAKWRRGFRNDSPASFHLFANLVLYATDPAALEGRFVSPPRRPAAAPRVTGSIPIARVRHQGGWNICPGAAERLSEVVAGAVGLGVKQGAPADLAGPVDKRTALLWLTGTADPGLTARQRGNLREYLVGGGMVFMDSAMGGGAFFDGAMKMLAAMFGRDSARPLPKTHPLLTGKFSGGMGADVTTVSYTRAAKKKPGAPVVHAVTIDGRVVAVLSPAGVTVPAAAVRSYGCVGLGTLDARRLAANVLLYAASHTR